MIIVLGINHKSASLELREKVAFPPETMPEALIAAMNVGGVSAVSILSTCNRTEIYAEVEDNGQSLASWLSDWHGISQQELTEIHYLSAGREAASHLMRVACGLDSLVLGEPQILGQIKSAYAVAQSAGALSPVLDRTFQQAFAVAKQVRSETAIGRNPVSVAYAAVRLASQIFTTLENKTALLVGAGDTITLVARHLREQGLQSMIIANRTLENADSLGRELNAEAILLSEIPAHLQRADVVVSSTASQLPLLGKGAVESALKKRRHRMMFMVDLAVPRDIEHEVADLEDVYLYTVDDLGAVVAENQKARQEAAEEAEQIIQRSVRVWEASIRKQAGANWVRDYREQCNGLRDRELAKALQQLEQGGNPAEVISRLANDLTNKLIHQPTSGLTEAIEKGEREKVDWTVKLLGVERDGSGITSVSGESDRDNE